MCSCVQRELCILETSFCNLKVFLFLLKSLISLYLLILASLAIRFIVHCHKDAIHYHLLLVSSCNFLFATRHFYNVRERSLFMGGMGTEEKVNVPSKNFTPPFAKVKLSLPHRRKTVEQRCIYV